MGGLPPNPVAPQALLADLLNVCNQYRQQGIFNCMLSNGDGLFTFCSSKLAQITRRAPFGEAQLADMDLTVDFKAQTTPNDIVSVIATEPLTFNEQWQLNQPGDWHLWKRGNVLKAVILTRNKKPRFKAGFCFYLPFIKSKG